MDPKRKKFQDEWLSFLAEMGADKAQIKMNADKFALMDDDSFKELVRNTREAGMTFPLLTFNMVDEEDEGEDHETVMAIGEKYGIVWFENLVLTDAITGETSVTPNKYVILEVSVRRLVQHMYKKRSVSENEYTKDRLTGQVTGDSKASSISKTELGILAAKSLDATALEGIKARAGDDEAWANMIEQIAATGEVSLDPILELDSRPTSLNTMNSFFAGMMLKSTL